MTPFFLVAHLCVILLVCWTLLVYVSIRLPLDDHFFGWIHRQWLAQGIIGLGVLGYLSARIGRWRRQDGLAIPWWRAWWCWIAWTGVSIVYSIDRGASLRNWLLFLSCGLLAYTVSALTVRSEQALLTWVKFLAACALVAGIEGLLQYAGIFSTTLPMLERLQASGELVIQGWGGGVIKDFLLRKRIFSVFGWPNLFAGFLLLMIPMTISVSVSVRSRPARVVWAIAGGILGLCLVLTLSMGAWVSAIITACVVWWFLRRPRARAAGVSEKTSRRSLMRMVIVGVTISVLLGITCYIVAKRARPFILASTVSRLAYVQGAWNILVTHPVIGTGFGTFGAAYHAMKPLEPTEGQHNAIHAHNTLLQVAAELGVIGLGLFVVFLWPVGRLIARSLRPPIRGPTRILQSGLAIGLLGFFIHSVLEQTFVEAVTAPFWWLGLGLLTSADGITRGDHEHASVRTHLGWRHQITSLVVVASGLLVLGRLVAADAWAARAAFLKGEGQLHRAHHAWAHAQRLNPLESRYAIEHAHLLMALAGHQRVEDGRESLRQAQRQFEQATVLSPWVGYAWMGLARISWQLEERERAIGAMTEAVRRDPNARASHVQLAQMLLAVGRSDELDTVAQRFQRLEPSDPQGYFWEALCWQRRGETARAIQAYRNLLAVVPTHHPALFNLALLLRQQGDADEAARLYETFLRHAPAFEAGPRQEAQAFLDAYHAKTSLAP